MDETVPKGWKTATYVLGAAVVAQFFWWDAKCPQVLRGKGYSGMQGLRGVDNARLVAFLNRDEPASYGGGMLYLQQRNELCKQATDAARAGEPVRAQIAEAARGARFPRRANELTECIPAGLGRLPSRKRSRAKKRGR